MVKRKPLKAYALLAFALIVMMMCWEANKTSAAVISPVIPEESIRLRILANSDSVEDQNMKRLIRDAIVEQMNGWVKGPHTLDEAREVVRGHLPELGDLVGRMLQDYGYDYGYQVELGIVPFPTKMYGDRVYPAGDYEALRVTLGQGAGQNWWCVLFPPLCFVDAAAGEAVAKAKTEAPSEKKDETKQSPQAKEQVKAKPANGTKVAAAPAAAAPAAKATVSEQAPVKKEVKFFVFEKAKQLFSWIKKLFS